MKLFYRLRHTLLLAIFLLLAPTLALSATPEQPARPAHWAVPVSPTHNLYRITPQLYRSAQIGKRDIALLQSLGIKTVVSLRALHSDRKLFKDSGIRIGRIKVITWKINDDHVVRALRAIKAAEKDGPVLLHCQHGADRTGTVSAMYRILYQNWTRERALDELLNGGYGYHSLWKNIPEYLKNVDIEAVRRQVEAS
ncbi:MAG: protein-tyrosine-phosphatase [Proteobacteria bacterium]|nr:protein-tyrosine-phosphatase [Pseudomonadota bacterium]